MRCVAVEVVVVVIPRACEKEGSGAAADLAGITRREEGALDSWLDDDGEPEGGLACGGRAYVEGLLPMMKIYWE